MPRPHSPYPPEFRAKMVALARVGRTVEELVAEFEPSHQTTRNWLAQAAADRGEPRNGIASPSSRANTQRGPPPMAAEPELHQDRVRSCRNDVVHKCGNVLRAPKDVDEIDALGKLADGAEEGLA